MGTWFDNSMDRVTGWYKRETQTTLFFLGMILAVFCNVDTIHIMRDLSRNPDKLAKVVDAAGKMQAAEKGKTPATNNSTEGGNTPPTTQPDTVTTATVELAHEFDSLKESLGRFTDLSLPIGWSASETGYFLTKLKPEPRLREIEKRIRDLREEQKQVAPCTDAYTALETQAKALEAKRALIEAERRLEPDVKKRNEKIEAARADAVKASVDLDAGGGGLATFLKQRMLAEGEDPHDYRFDKSHIFGALFGWLMAALAASLGAPFWFDTLNRVMTIRSAGKAPEEKDTGEPTKKDQDAKNNSPQRPSGAAGAQT
jgi:hypothetical protein